KVAGDGDAGRQVDSREVDLVAAAALQLRRKRGIARPQPDGVSHAGQVHGQRRAEAAGADDGDAAHEITRCPSRRSLPASSRARLPRWRNSTSAPAAPAASTTARGAPAPQASGASATAASIEPTETKRVSQTAATN